MSDISVIICTHNPRRDYLGRALEALRLQTLPVDNWDLLVVDNASETRLADEWDLSWHPHSRHIREDELGLTPARLRGIKESSGDLLVFVDDDNVLAPDFLEQAAAVPENYPHLGVFGAGVLEPEFETPPPRAVVPWVPMLALRTVNTAVWSNNPNDHSCIPYGAGICVTQRVASAFQRLVGAMNVSGVVGRRGGHLFCGEDELFSWAASMSGEGFGVLPELRVTHLIVGERLNRRYIVRLVHDHALSHGVIRYLLTGVKPERVELFQHARGLLHVVRNGTFSAQCRWAELRGRVDAARFISDHQLHPLEALAFGKRSTSMGRRLHRR
jgi:glycosyltransferase involved in cell wall biosynthesis